jgi:hypothetical protein
LQDHRITCSIKEGLTAVHLKLGMPGFACEVDWEFKPDGVPLYLFGVKDAAKARLTTISCLEFQRAQLRYKSIVVHEDFNKLGRKDVTRLTSACDKQFTNLDDFEQNAMQYLEREVHA